MRFFYLITEDQANQIGSFPYTHGKDFDPLEFPQGDGIYAIDAILMDRIGHFEQFSHLDFSKLEIINELNLKQ